MKLLTGIIEHIGGTLLLLVGSLKHLGTLCPE